MTWPWIIVIAWTGAVIGGTAAWWYASRPGREHERRLERQYPSAFAAPAVPRSQVAVEQHGRGGALPAPTEPQQETP